MATVEETFALAMMHHQAGRRSGRAVRTLSWWSGLKARKRAEGSSIAAAFAAGVPPPPPPGL